MTVKELIDKLKDMPQDEEIFVYDRNIGEDVPAVEVFTDIPYLCRNEKVVIRYDIYKDGK